jgi:hypothetical protein
MDDPGEWMRGIVEEIARQEAARLEDEARIWLRMGFEIDELANVHRPDEEPHIQPIGH